MTCSFYLHPYNIQRRENEGFLTCANDHMLMPSHECGQNKLAGVCSFVGCQLLQKVSLMSTIIYYIISKAPSLGKEEDHKEWDAREELRPLLEEEVEKVLGYRGDNEFIYGLLCDDEIVEISRTISDGHKESEGMRKLSELMQQKKTEHVPTAEKRICIAFLKGIVKEALGDQKDFPDALLYDLLENKDILATIVALKRAYTNKAEGAMATARLKLLKLLGNAR